MLLISVHVPKTAGQTVRWALQEHFGDRFVRDSGDRPIHQTLAQRRLQVLAAMAKGLNGVAGSIDCIHGHFLAIKYLPASVHRPTRFITWMRHPVQRLLSHYHYWAREAPLSADDTLHWRMRREGWSLERFAFCPELRNIYGSFYWRFPLNWFAMVGVVEQFDADFAWLCENLLHRRPMIQKRNVNPDKPADRRYPLDAGLERAIAEYHADDMRLYEQALQLRCQRHS